jgi:hypothetical protein
MKRSSCPVSHMHPKITWILHGVMFCNCIYFYTHIFEIIHWYLKAHFHWFYILKFNFSKNEANLLFLNPLNIEIKAFLDISFNWKQNTRIEISQSDCTSMQIINNNSKFNLHKRSYFNNFFLLENDVTLMHNTISYFSSLNGLSNISSQRYDIWIFFDRLIWFTVNCLHQPLWET